MYIRLLSRENLWFLKVPALIIRALWLTSILGSIVFLFMLFHPWAQSFLGICSLRIAQIVKSMELPFAFVEFISLLPINFPSEL
jgi:hypothetical protein